MSTDNENQGRPDVKIVTIMRFYHVSEAEMAVSMLEEEGIKCGLIGANLYNANCFYGLAAGGIRLEVAQSDAPRASKLLREMFPPEQISSDLLSQPLPQEPQDEEKCPQCGGGNITFEKYSWRTFLISMVVFGFPLPIKENQYHCLDCGNRWKRP